MASQPEVEPSAETPSERFDHFMDRSLYGPDGFYTGSGGAGRRSGDFITSPEVGPLFGAVLAEAIDSWWEDLGRPDPMPVYDVGCGPGTLLKAVAMARPDRPWELIGVDRAGSAAARVERLPDDLSGAIVVANELLDNLPFRVVARDDHGFSEVHVEHRDGHPTEVLEPTDLQLDIPVGTRAPYLEAAGRWVGSTLERGPAKLCVFDYGAARTGDLAARGGWLRTYRRHQRGSDPLRNPGSADITTDVAWDQLPVPRSLASQAEFLRRWEIDRLVEDGRRYWTEHSARPDLTAIRMRSRISEAEALLDPAGLGAWWVAVW